MNANLERIVLHTKVTLFHQISVSLNPSKPSWETWHILMASLYYQHQYVSMRLQRMLMTYSSKQISWLKYYCMTLPHQLITLYSFYNQMIRMGVIIIIIIVEDSTNSVTADGIIIGHVSLGEEGTQRKQYGMELGALNFTNCQNGLTGQFNQSVHVNATCHQCC